MAGLLPGLAPGRWGSSGHCLEFCLQDDRRSQSLLAPGLKTLRRRMLFLEQPVGSVPPGRASSVSLVLCPRQSDLALTTRSGAPGGPEPLREAGFGDSTGGEY